MASFVTRISLTMMLCVTCQFGSLALAFEHHLAASTVARLSGEIKLDETDALPPKQTSFDWLDPRGLSGKLLMTSSDPSKDAAAWIARSVPEGEPCQILILSDAPIPMSVNLRELISTWLKSEQMVVQSSHPFARKDLQIKDEEDEIDSSSLKVISEEDLADSIGESSLVWLISKKPLTETMEFGTDWSPAVVSALKGYLDDKRILVCSGISPNLIVEAPSLGLLPFLHFETQSRNVDEKNDVAKNPAQKIRIYLASHPDRVGVACSPDAELLITGRLIRSFETGQVSVHLAEVSHKQAQEFVLKGRQSVMDLTSLRRAARDRISEPFPSTSITPSEVIEGTLIIIGGGGMPNGIIDRFVELAGGPEANIVVLPTAMPDPLPERNGIAEAFKRSGAKSVHVLNGRTPELVESEEYLEIFSEATGIWFGGGRQWRFIDAYENTAVVPLMHEVLEKGGVIMGSSAGASIQAEYLARSTPIGNTSIYADGYERGLGFLPGAAVDQHFSQRNRFNDLQSLIERYPQLLGIGIDEATAIIVEGKVAKVVGRGGTHFLDAQKREGSERLQFESVYAGGSYHLIDRAIIDAGTKSESGSRPRTRTPRPPRPPISKAERIERVLSQLMSRLDENQNQVLEESEWQNSRFIDASADKNQDGNLSKQELQNWLSSRVR